MQDISLDNIIVLVLSIVFAIKLIFVEMTLVNMYPKLGRSIMGIVYLLGAIILFHTGYLAFAVLSLIFSVISVVMAAIVEHIRMMDMARFKEWQKYIKQQNKLKKLQ